MTLVVVRDGVLSHFVVLFRFSVAFVVDLCYTKEKSAIGEKRIIMKIHFLGTGAADWNPSLATADRNFRRLSSILVDDCLLIDPGPCLPEFVRTFDCPTLFTARGLDAIVNTHRHNDHYCDTTVDWLGREKFVETPAWSHLETAHHKIDAYPAHHGTARDAVHLVIENKSDGKRFFYGCDGSFLYYETAHALLGQHFDLMIFDGTIGNIPGEYRIFEHNNLPMVRELKAAFAKNAPRFMISHLARTLHPIHDEEAPVLMKEGIEVAFDNMVVEL